MSLAFSGRSLIDTTAHAANDTLAVAQNGTAHTNAGASGAVVLALPPATAGLHYYFQVAAAQALRVDPNGAETISLPSTGIAGAAGKYLGSSTVGATLHLACFTAGTWSVLGYTASWAAEP